MIFQEQITKDLSEDSEEKSLNMIMSRDIWMVITMG